MIFDARCPHCSASHVVPATEIGEVVRCPKCNRDHPVHPKAGSATEGLLAALLESHRKQHTALRRLESSLSSLRLGLAIIVPRAAGLRVAGQLQVVAAGRRTSSCS